MPRRIHLPYLTVGDIDLPDSQARHVRDALRLGAGDALEAFDDGGSTASATILAATATHVTIRIAQIISAEPLAFTWTIASAVPKGPRADWMVEKLSELGASKFIPLITARSVSLPTGKEKLDRWSRLAAESAKQSGRAGVMGIEPLTPLENLIGTAKLDETRWYFSTRPDVTPVARLVQNPPPKALLMLIGPEGGWTDEEIGHFEKANLHAVKLTATILRIETAAIAAAVMTATWFTNKVS